MARKEMGYKLSSLDRQEIAKTLWPLIDNKQKSWIDMEEYGRRHPDNGENDALDPCGYGNQHG